MDSGFQDTFRGLKVKGEACVWCGGVYGAQACHESLQEAQIYS